MSKFINLIKGQNQTAQTASEAVIIPRGAHVISRKNISANAIKVLYRLKNSGYEAYLVGGCVRDMLLGREPKDFDIATNALPHEISHCFRNGRIIGRRFRLVHILFKGEIIEVSTFRQEHAPHLQEKSHTEAGILVHDNVYGTLEDDAHRRDFTINALYYNIADFSVVDFHHGLADLNQGILRIIGDPKIRYREDPVRMLRAVRLAAKLGFRIHADSEAAIFEEGHLLSMVSSHRLFTEVVKLFLNNSALLSFSLLRHYKLFRFLFPDTEKFLNKTDYLNTNTFLTHAFTDTDARLCADKTVSPGYLIAALLWHPLQARIKELLQEDIPYVTAFNLACYEISQTQQKHVNIPGNFMFTARTIWDFQYRFEKRKRSKCIDLLAHPRFRAAYDFLLLRWRSGENIQPLCDWWTNFYEGDMETRTHMLNQLKKR